MGNDEKQGLNAAVNSVDVGEAPGVAGGEQLSLMPSEAMKQDLAADDATAERAGAGRPPGSKNKRTSQWTDYLLGRYTSPLIFLAETYSRPVKELKKELGCNAEDAFKIQLAAAKELAPYVHQKQPVSVEVDSKGVVQLIVEASPEMAKAMGSVPQNADGSITIEADVIEVENDDKSST